MLDEHIDTLLKTPLFHNFDAPTLKGMRHCLNMSVASYGKGEYIAHRGLPFEKVGVVAEGEAAIIKESALGKRIIIELLGKGNVFGETAAFAGKQVWYYSVQAQSECEVIFIPKGRIIGECANLCQCHRRLIENFLTILSERNLYLDKKIEYFAIKSVTGKICAYLYDQYKLNGGPLFDIPFDRNELADFLNVSRPTLSRELAKLKGARHNRLLFELLQGA